MMKTITTALLLASTTAFAAGETDHYAGYFDSATINDIETTVSLYNHENGYWENDKVLNSELRRYLLEKDVVKRADFEDYSVL